MTVKTEKKCRNAECGKIFKLFRSTDKFCSPECQRKCTDPKPKKVIDWNAMKPRKPINKVSKKQAVILAKYSVLRIQFLSRPENKICPITGKPTTDIHHKKGRLGDLLLDINFWVALSRDGHRFVEENPVWAKENGYSLDRLSE